MIASFSSLGVDLPSIALIVLHSFVGSVLRFNVSTNCLHFGLLCLFLILVISYFISCRAGEVESLDLWASRALIFSNISVLSRGHPEVMWCDDALRMMAQKIFSPFGSWPEAVFCSACLLSLYCIGPNFPFSD